MPEDNGTVVTRVEPLYSLAEIVFVPGAVGVKPVPEIETPLSAAVPATTFVVPTAIAGVPNTVRIVLAVLPEASLTSTTSVPGACVADRVNPTATPVYRVPTAFVSTTAWLIDAAVAPLKSSQVVAVPLTVKVCNEFIAKPEPVMTTFAPGLTAARSVNDGVTVKVAVAYAPVLPATLTV